MLFVVAEHLAGSPVAAKIPAFGKLLQFGFNFGIYGVVVFFCISGFIIPYSILGIRDRPALRFPVVRVFRLYPAYWLSLVLAIAILHPPVKQVLINITMLQRFFSSADVVGAYWTLQIEILFYLIFQAIILFGKINVRRLYPVLAISFAILSVVMAAARYHSGKKLPLSPALGLAVMFLATTYFMHVTHELFSRKTMIALAVCIYALMVLAFHLGYSRNYGDHETPIRYYLSYLFAFLTFLAFEAANLRSSVLAFAGRISYPVYLIHTSIMSLVVIVFAHYSIHSRPATIITVLVLTTVVAIPMHYGIEMPCVRLGKRLLNHWFAT